MDRKKGIIAIVLFVFLGLMVFSFANPADEEATTKLDSTNSENLKEDEEKQEVEQKEETEEEESNSDSTERRPVVNSNLLTGNTSSDLIEDNDDEETTTNPSDDEVEEDENEVEDEEKNYEAIIALVNNLETMVNSAITSTEITDMDIARDYNINEKIEELVSKIEDEETKKELTEKLDELYKVLNDEVKPKPYSLSIYNYTHDTEGGDVKVANTGDFIRVIAYYNEKLNVTPKATIDGLEGEYELNYSEAMSTSTRFVYVRKIKLLSNNEIKDGDLLVKVSGCKDMSNNSCVEIDSTMTDIQNSTYPYVNFDKTAPKFNIGNGASFESNVIEVTDENFDYMIVQDMTTGKTERITEPTYELKSDKDVENGRFDFIAYDKAGNVSKRTNYYLDNVKPVLKATGLVGGEKTTVVDGNSYQKVTINVSDANLNKVVVVDENGNETVLKSYKWNDKNRNFEYTFDKDGFYKVYAMDRASDVNGHKVELTFHIDNEAPVITLQGNFVGLNKNEVYININDTLDSINLKALVTDNVDEDVEIDYSKITFYSVQPNTAHLNDYNAESIYTNKEGRWNLDYTYTDAAGNTGTRTMMIIIRDNRELKEVSKTINTNVNENKDRVLVSVITNKQLKSVPEGWALTYAGTGAVKMYFSNTASSGEDLVFTDFSGNKITVNVKVDSIIDGAKLVADGKGLRFETLNEALINIKENNYTNATITIKDTHTINSKDLIGGTNTKSITIKGSNNNSKVLVDGNGTDSLRTANSNLVVKFDNLSIDDISNNEYYKCAWEYYYLEFAGNFEFNNCYFEHPPMTNDNNSTYKFTNCEFTSHAYKNCSKNPEYAIWVYSGTKTTIENSIFNGLRGIKVSRYYHDSDVKDVYINNCTFNNLTQKPGIVIGETTENTDIYVTNNTFKNTTVAGDQNNWTIESDTIGPKTYVNNTLNGLLHTLPNPYLNN